MLQAKVIQSAGYRFRQALLREKPLQLVGTLNANHALLAEHAGFQSIYLSGGGVSAGSLGLPDLGVLSLEDVLVDCRRITDVCSTPLIVDIDTGFGSSCLNIERTIQSLIKAGAAGCHIEDQAGAKRCGHRPGKELVSAGEMAERVYACHSTRLKFDPNFYLIARTDALEEEGLEGVIERSKLYIEAGADAIFLEAVRKKGTYRDFVNAMPSNTTVLANMTEFGKTPLMTLDELRSEDVGIVLYVS